MERARALAHAHRPLGQGHPLVAAQGARQAVDPAACAARRSGARQQGALPRLPAQRGTPAALPTRRSHARACAPRRLAGLGHPLTPTPLRPARADDPPPPHRHPHRHPTRPHQRSPRGPQQPHPPHQPPQLRLPLRRPPHRPRVPLLHRHRNRTPTTTIHHRITRRAELSTRRSGALVSAKRHRSRSSAAPCVRWSSCAFASTGSSVWDAHHMRARAGQ